MLFILRVEILPLLMPKKVPSSSALSAEKSSSFNIFFMLGVVRLLPINSRTNSNTLTIQTLLFLKVG